MNKETMDDILQYTKKNIPIPYQTYMQPYMNIHTALDFIKDETKKLHLHIEYLLEQYVTDRENDQLQIRNDKVGEYQYFLNKKFIFAVQIHSKGYNILSENDLDLSDEELDALYYYDTRDMKT